LPTLTPYDGTDPTQLTAALLAPSSGITIVGPVVVNASALEAINFYDDPQATALGIGSGLLLTSGTKPGFSNTMEWFGQDNGIPFDNGDADIDAVVNTVFQTQSYDATTLSFDFIVADPAATSVSFDLVFGSDEFPEWVDLFVDCAVVIVNGVNYALFNHDPLHPLSVISPNLAAGYFQDNAGNVLPIEYDGVSKILKIVAPIIPGGAVNHIKIGIADTGDHILDSGIFIANLSAGTTPGSGVVNPITCDDSSNSVNGSAQDEYFDLKGGDDIAYAGAGDDIVVAGSGNDTVYGGSGSDQIKGDEGNDLIDGGDGDDTAVYSAASTDYIVSSTGSGYTISAKPGIADGLDTLTSVEFVKFSDGLFTFGPGATLVPVTDPGTTPPTNSPGTVFVTGFAAAGQTLTATVSDPDGIPGAIAYRWESSADGGSNWSPIGGATASTYDVTAGDAGLELRVAVSYSDGKSHAEALFSAAKPFVPSDDGDFTIELIVLTAPTGASVMTPLTTLVSDIIQLGVSPNLAAQYVNAVLGIDPPVNLLHYDAWEAVQADPELPPTDVQAFNVEKVSVQVAVLTSLSGDQTGLATAQAIVSAGLAGLTLDLTNADDIAGILKLDPSNPVVGEIADRNWNIFEANTVADIEAVWADILNGGLSTTLADLSAHINQPPIGFALAVLPPGVQDAEYTIDAATLLMGFSDADGGTLAVANLKADFGDATVNLDGTFKITPNAGYAGPVELTYQVLDGQGGSAEASQMFIVAPGGGADHGATGTLTISGTVQEGATISADTTGISDPDGSFTASYQWQMYDSGSSSWQNIAGATNADLVIPIGQTYVGLEVRVTATTTDGFGGTTDFQSAGHTVAAGSGLTLVGTEQADVLDGSPWDDSLSGLSGNDILNGSGGNDTVAGGAGVDTLILNVDTLNVLTNGYQFAPGLLSQVGSSLGTVDLSGIERVKLTDGLYAFDTLGPSGSDPGGKVWQAAALYRAGFGQLPDQAILSRWTAQADVAADMGELGQAMIDFYAPGVSNEALVTHLYFMLTGVMPTPQIVQTYAGLIGGQFETQGDLFAFAASLAENTAQMPGFVGSIQTLDPSWFPLG